VASRGQKSLPPPAPPAERTAGQLVGEAMRLYGRRLWAALLIGLPPTLAGVLLAVLADSGASRIARLSVALAAGAPALSASYVAASVIATGRRPPGRTLLVAFVAGVLVLLPVPFLATLLVLPALAWFALFGLAVPAAIVEQLELKQALARAVQLARADFVHVLGSLAATVIVAFVSAGVLQFLLVQFGETAAGVAAFIAIILLAPLVLFAAALLYFDQAARVVATPSRKGLTAPRPRRAK
jgi:MFS family permease